MIKKAFLVKLRGKVERYERLERLTYEFREVRLGGKRS